MESELHFYVVLANVQWLEKLCSLNKKNLSDILQLFVCSFCYLTLERLSNPPPPFSHTHTHRALWPRHSALVIVDKQPGRYMAAGNDVVFPLNTALRFCMLVEFCNFLDNLYSPDCPESPEPGLDWGVGRGVSKLAKKKIGRCIQQPVVINIYATPGITSFDWIYRARRCHEVDATLHPYSMVHTKDVGERRKKLSNPDKRCRETPSSNWNSLVSNLKLLHETLTPCVLTIHSFLLLLPSPSLS